MNTQMHHQPGLGFSVTSGKMQSLETPLLVTIFLRGGADGLSVVAPYADDNYYRNRRLTALSAPGSLRTGAVSDLDGFFGAHPALAPLLPLYHGGDCAFVHACGSGDRTLSHFEARATVERGLSGANGVSSGWLARYLDLAAAPVSDSPLRAVAIGSMLPGSLQGASHASAIQDLRDLSPRSPFAGGDVAIFHSLADMYAHGGDTASLAGAQTLSLIRRLSQIPPKAQTRSTRYGGDDFAQGLRQIAILAKANIGLLVGCLEQNGYDTHVVQGNQVGQLATLLAQLASGIAAFAADLGGELWKRTKVVVVSEFGRRVAENDGGGTDHGHAGVMMVLGGHGVNGGKVHGRWPGLGDTQLDSNGNLLATTDYRDVLADIVCANIGCVDPGAVFPELKRRPAGVVYA